MNVERYLMGRYNRLGIVLVKRPKDWVYLDIYLWKWGWMINLWRTM